MLSGFFLKDTQWLWPAIVTVVILFGAIIIYGSFFIQANFFVDSINRGEEQGIAFTFDDGPDPITTPKILSILEAEKIKATFFVIGEKAEKHPELIIEMDKKGHSIANHSYEHSNTIGFTLTEKLSSDIKKCSDVIENAIGKRPRMFRPPFGVTNPKFFRVLKELHLTSIGWSGRSLDTITFNKSTLVNRVKRSVKNGAILLFHDTQHITLEALPEIINHCRKNGIKIVSLQELIKLEPYEK